MKHYDEGNMTIPQLIRICKKAKTVLWNGKGVRPYGKKEYVCYCLDDAAEKLFGLCGAPAVLGDMVYEYLEDCTYLESFLYRKFGREAVEKAGKANTQKWRKLLLDTMIKELEACK